MGKTRVINKIWQFIATNLDKDTIVIYGGAGAGKSYTVARYLIYRALLEPLRILVVRKVMRSLRDSVYPIIREALSEMDVEYQDKIAEFRILIKDSEIWLRGLDNPEKLKSSEFNMIWLEEATECTKDDFLYLQMRLRRKSKSLNQMFITFNPVNVEWLVELVKDKNVPSLRVTYNDNPFLNKEYSELLEQLKHENEELYQIYTLGEFATPQTIIYTNWDVVNNQPTKLDDVFYGLDFGFNNPTCLLKVGIKDNEIYVLDELYRSHLTNSELIEQLKELNVSKNVPIFADSAEPDRIKEIQQAGYWIQGVKKNVKDGIDKVKRRKINIINSCVNTIREIKNYSWRKKGDTILDEPVKFDDHAMDALRYAITGYFEQSKPNIYVLDI